MEFGHTMIQTCKINMLHFCIYLPWINSNAVMQKYMYIIYAS